MRRAQRAQLLVQTTCPKFIKKALNITQGTRLVTVATEKIVEVKTNMCQLFVK